MKLNSKKVLFAVGGAAAAYLIVKWYINRKNSAAYLVRDVNDLRTSWVPQMNPMSKNPPAGYRPAYGWSALPSGAGYTGRVVEEAAPFATISSAPRYKAEIKTASGGTEWLLMEKS